MYTDYHCNVSFEGASDGLSLDKKNYLWKYQSYKRNRFGKKNNNNFLSFHEIFLVQNVDAVEASELRSINDALERSELYFEVKT